MVGQRTAPRSTRVGDHSAGRRAPGVAGIVPVLLLGAWVAFLLLQADVDARSLLRFGAYVLVCLTLPGTLLWRMLVARGPRPWVEDVVMGTILAWVVEVPTYLLARWLDHPRWGVAWVVVVVAVALVLPGRRRRWAPSEVHRLPLAWTWATAGLLAVVAGYFHRFVWRSFPVDGAGLRYPYVDSPFQQSLAVELRHHVPAQFPYVPDELMQYHWFVHADVAAASWYSGVETVDLLQRLSPLLMVALALVGSALVAGRLAGSQVWGLAAPGALVLVGYLAPAGQETNLFLSSRLFLSPTHTYGTVVCVLVLALVLRLLDDQRPPRTIWWALVPAMVLLAGSKATFVPVIGAGLAAVVLVHAVRRRRLQRTAVGILAACAVAMALTQVLVFGPSAPGLELSPLGSAVGNARSLGLGDDPSVLLSALGMLAYLVPKAALAVGAVGLLVAGRWRDERAVLLVASTVAGVGATYTFVHPDFSQYYFLLSTLVPAAIASAWGLERLWNDPRARPRRRTALVVAGGFVVAGFVVGDAQRWGWTPSPATVSVLPLVLALAAVVVAALVGLRRPGALALVAVTSLAAIGVGSSLVVAADVAADPVLPAWSLDAAGLPTPALGPGGVDAARWLRRHSTPDQRAATNVHCRNAGTAAEVCDRRAFMLTAFSERRFVLEGWAYTPRNARRASVLGDPACCTSFSDPVVQQENDAVFDRPTERSMQRLVRAHDVRWLVVDRSLGADVDGLRDLATIRYRAGQYLVMEVDR